MITAAVVTFHTSRKDLVRLMDCVLQSSIDKFFIIDNSTNDALREFASASERIAYIHSDNLGFGSGHNVAINRAIGLRQRLSHHNQSGYLLGWKYSRRASAIYE